jgi:hypothetical protein
LRDAPNGNDTFWLRSLGCTIIPGIQFPAPPGATIMDGKMFVNSWSDFSQVIKMGFVA